MNCPCCIISEKLSEKIADYLGKPKKQKEIWLQQDMRQHRQVLSKNTPAKSWSFTKEKPQLEILDASGTTTGTVIYESGDEPPMYPLPAVEVYKYANIIWKFFFDVFDWSGIDGKGTPIQLVIAYENDFSNALWDGTMMLFGNGDGTVLDRFTKDLGVISHECGHGITQNRSIIGYSGQAGSVNEAFSDLWGCMVMQFYKKQQPEEADWLIGDEIWKPWVQKEKNVTAVRSLLNPGTAYDSEITGKDEQPAHYDKLFTGKSNNGGVHVNSGIVNKAMATAAIKHGGYSWMSVGKLLWSCYEDLKENTNIEEFANITKVKSKQFSDNLNSAVKAGWKTVGL